MYKAQDNALFFLKKNVCLQRFKCCIEKGRDFYSSLGISNALNHPLLQVQPPTEKKQALKEQTKQRNKPCTKLSTKSIRSFQKLHKSIYIFISGRSLFH